MIFEHISEILSLKLIRYNKILQEKLDFNILEKILCEEKGNQHDRIFFNRQKIEEVLPPELLKRDKRYIEEYVVEAIKKYNKNKKISIQ